jgi:cobalt/nickel transport system permease protein
VNRWPAVALYGASLVVFSVLQDARWLAAGLLAWLVVAGGSAPRLLRRTMLAVGVFSLGVSGGVVLTGWLGEGIDGGWLLKTNLRVVLVTACTLLAVERIAWRKTFARWPALVASGVMIQSQIRVLQRLLDDFRMGLRSRSPRRPGPRTVLRHSAASGSFFLGRAIGQADEIGLAMRARGVGHARR